jgi:hypothetical protein
MPEKKIFISMGQGGFSATDDSGEYAENRDKFLLGRHIF